MLFPMKQNKKISPGLKNFKKLGELLEIQSAEDKKRELHKNAQIILKQKPRPNE